MRNLYLLLLLSLMLTKAFAAASCQTDSVEIIKKVKSMNAAFEKGDAQALVDMTDPALFELSGGKETALAASKKAMEQMQASGLKVEKSVIGKPTKTYMAGTKSVCFIPKEVIMSVDGVRARSESYLVAINRNTANSSWLFLDSSGFQKKAELLWKLVPGLPKDVKLPPNNMELMQAK